MSVDWFTFTAQIVNFLILVYLLRRFLYTPILRAIDDREKAIANRLALAEVKLVEAGKEADDYRHKNQDFDERREAMISDVRKEADAERTRLLDQANREMDALRAKRRDAIRSEEQELNREIVRWTQDEVFAIARKTLADLASASLEERISRAFLDRLRGMNDPEKERLAAALNKPSSSALVRTSFDLPPAEQEAIEVAIRETLATNTRVQYETAPELVSGIELSANGHKIAWSIGDYLEKLEESVAQILSGHGKFGSNPEAPPRQGLETTSSIPGGHA
ncbi:F0F1 ATP synthase subunit B [Tundrisphaera lichenicola]|uniref:F0F1 ATP synthase subunit B family protein n=1 Tax=Tundrisphaera lichenicola TaxID=2029860 RepID=UPI003EBCE3D5